MINAAGWAQLHPPHWSRLLMIAAVVVWVAAFVADFFTHSVSTQRRLYWLGWIGGGMLAAASLSFRGWGVAAGVFGLVVFAALGYAYVFTSFLKIGDRIFALSERRRQPGPDGAPRAARDAYGDISAAKFWWLIAFLMILGGADVALRGWGWVPIALTVMMIAIAAMSGADDARRRLPVVRRQYLQALIAAVASIPMFGAPVVVYVLAYVIGKRVPARYGRHDAFARPDPQRGEGVSRRNGSDPHDRETQ